MLFVIDYIKIHTSEFKYELRLSYYNEMSYLRINGKNEISVKSTIVLEIYSCGGESYVVRDSLHKNTYVRVQIRVTTFLL